jgi:hypothetical protein
LDQTATAVTEAAARESTATAGQLIETAPVAPAAAATGAATARFSVQQLLEQIVGKRSLALMLASQQLLILPTADLVMQRMPQLVAPPALDAFSGYSRLFINPSALAFFAFNAPLPFRFPAVFGVDFSVAVLFEPVAVSGFGCWGGPMLPGWAAVGGCGWGGPLVLAPAAKNTVMTHCWEQLAALLSSGAAPHMLSAALGVRSLPGCGGADSAPPQLLLTAQVSVTETGLQLLVSLFAAPTAAPAMTASWPEWTHRPQSGTGGTTWQACCKLKIPRYQC